MNKGLPSGIVESVLEGVDDQVPSGALAVCTDDCCCNRQSRGSVGQANLDHDPGSLGAKQISQVDGDEMTGWERRYICRECQITFERDASGLFVEVDD